MFGIFNTTADVIATILRQTNLGIERNEWRMLIHSQAVGEKIKLQAPIFYQPCELILQSPLSI